MHIVLNVGYLCSNTSHLLLLKVNRKCIYWTHLYTCAYIELTCIRVYILNSLVYVCIYWTHLYTCAYIELTCIRVHILNSLVYVCIYWTHLYTCAYIELTCIHVHILNSLVYVCILKTPAFDTNLSHQGVRMKFKESEI